jgi:hypothetical protein
LEEIRMTYVQELFEEHKFKADLRRRERIEYEAAMRERARIEASAPRRPRTVARDVETLRGRHRAGRLSVTTFFTIREAALIAGMGETEIRTALGRDEARGMFEEAPGHFRTAYRGELSTHVCARELTRLLAGPAVQRALEER